MLYTKHNFEVARFCASGGRPELGAVLVAPDKTAATDSYVLVEVTTPTAHNDEKDFPAVSGSAVKTATTPFLFPGGAAREVAKHIPKRPAAPVLERAAVIETPEDTAGFVTTDLERTTPVVARRVAGSFPDYARIFPRVKPRAVVDLNAAFLKKLATFFSEFAPAPDHRVTLVIYGPEKPVLLKAKNSVQKARALLMPIQRAGR